SRAARTALRSPRAGPGTTRASLLAMWSTYASPFSLVRPAAAEPRLPPKSSAPAHTTAPLRPEQPGSRTLPYNARPDPRPPPGRRADADVTLPTGPSTTEETVILTLTPNPSLDLLFEAETLRWNDANRVEA